MAWKPTLLEDSLDPWLATEGDSTRRRAVLAFLVDLCAHRGHLDGAAPVRGTRLPAFAAAVPDADVVVVWVVAESFQETAVRFLYDMRRGQRFGG